MCQKGEMRPFVKSGLQCQADVPLLPALFGKALVERMKIDHNALVGSAADILIVVACRYFEVNSFSLDVDYLGRRSHLVAHRRSSEVPYIYCSADRAFTCVQKRFDGIERGIFHDQNHHGRRKHLRQYGVLESVGKMFGLHPQDRHSSGSQRNLPHSFVLYFNVAATASPQPQHKGVHLARTELSQTRKSARATAMSASPR